MPSRKRRAAAAKKRKSAELSDNKSQNDNHNVEDIFASLDEEQETVNERKRKKAKKNTQKQKQKKKQKRHRDDDNEEEEEEEFSSKLSRAERRRLKQTNAEKQQEMESAWQPIEMTDDFIFAQEGLEGLIGFDVMDSDQYFAMQGRQDSKQMQLAHQQELRALEGKDNQKKNRKKNQKKNNKNEKNKGAKQAGSSRSLTDYYNEYISLDNNHERALEWAKEQVNLDRGTESTANSSSTASALKKREKKEKGEEEEKKKKKKKKNKNKLTRKERRRRQKEKKLKAEEQARHKQQQKQERGNNSESELLDQKQTREWDRFDLDPLLMKGIRALGFEKPTPIQAACLPAALQQWKDVIGCAQTGSGKTLAFGIPILQQLMTKAAKHKEKYSGEELPPGMFALVLCPTRELAIQVCDHINRVAKFTPHKAVPMTGGMATQKQERLLSYRPRIVVATPGRLWALIKEGAPHLLDLSQLSVFVLDEADRMVASGHFPELTNILTHIQADRIDDGFYDSDQDDVDEKDFMYDYHEKNINNDDDVEGRQLEIRTKAHPALFRQKKKRVDKRQTFLFSATFSLDAFARIEHSIKRSKKKRIINETNMLDRLADRIKFRGDPFVVDLSSKTHTASGLTEYRLECLDQDKDFYLYYFLHKHPGRTLVFVNSIASTQRLASLFSLFGRPAWPLHSKLQMRQRLKNVERFTDARGGNSLIICTDVAARGLDIPDVQHVVHYQLPRSSEIYVHRAGRTARAQRQGNSLCLVGPSDAKSYSRICYHLNKTDGMEPFDVEDSVYRKVKDRVKLAAQIDQMENGLNKKAARRSWFQINAEAAGIELDEHFYPEIFQDQELAHEDKRARKQVKRLKAQLNALCSEPLIAAGVSRRYYTFNQTIPENPTDLDNLRR